MSLPQLLLQTMNQIGGENTNLNSVLQTYMRSQGVETQDFWKPSHDIIETNENITIFVDMPGVMLNTIDVDFFNNKVQISGSRTQPYDENPLIKEIIYGDYNRNITLPISVTNKDSVNISSKNGVLKIIINKINEEKNKFKIKLNNEEIITN